MAKDKRPKGPAMAWLEPLSEELVELFAKEFFDSNRRMKSAFKCGNYRAAPEVALRMVKWWSSFGVRITLHQIRPDVYGESDTGPVNV